MGRKILVIVAHPDPKAKHLCRALADAYCEGATSAGHAVRRIDLAQIDVPLLRSEDEFLHGTVPEALRSASEAITEAEHLVLLFPLWLGTMPALLKAFLEQVMRPGVAFDYADAGRGFPKPALRGRSARVVVTMGMPTLLYRLWYRDHGIACLRRNILNFAGIRPVRETLFGMVGAGSDAKRTRWIAKIRRLGTRRSLTNLIRCSAGLMKGR